MGDHCGDGACGGTTPTATATTEQQQAEATYQKAAEGGTLTAAEEQLLVHWFHAASETMEAAGPMVETATPSPVLSYEDTGNMLMSLTTTSAEATTSTTSTAAKPRCWVQDQVNVARSAARMVLFHYYATLQACFDSNNRVIKNHSGIIRTWTGQKLATGWTRRADYTPRHRFGSITVKGIAQGQFTWLLPTSGVAMSQRAPCVQIHIWRTSRGALSSRNTSCTFY